MINTKRKIETEQDKYGGYEESTSSERSIFRTTSESIEIPDSSPKTFSRMQASTNLYSGRVIEQPSKNSDTEKPLKKNKISEDDLMPSIKTMSYAEQKKQGESREALESKTKLMLAIYMIVVVLLAAIVIGTGIVINNISANINGLQKQLMQKQEIAAVQNEERAISSDPYAIQGRAKDPNGLNMAEFNPDDYEIDYIIPFSEPAPVAKSSDPFDKLCDFVQDLFGK